MSCLTRSTRRCSSDWLHLWRGMRILSLVAVHAPALLSSISTEQKQLLSSLHRLGAARSIRDEDRQGSVRGSGMRAGSAQQALLLPVPRQLCSVVQHSLPHLLPAPASRPREPSQGA